MKKLFCLLALFLALGAHVAFAGFFSTNLLGLATFSAGNNTNAGFLIPGTHAQNAHAFPIYHSVTNASWPSTNYAEISFDGGFTWAVYATNIPSTNSQTETWNIPQGSMTYTNRLRTATTTNQTLLNQVNYNN
jgi:hypothetical protein